MALLTDLTQDAEYQGVPFLTRRSKPGLDMNTVDVQYQAAPFIEMQDASVLLSAGTIVIITDE